MSSPIITLTTDFGEGGSYVAQMKAVLLSLAPEATLVDISHRVPPFDVQAGARILGEAAPFFPPQTIHIAVVDPGVGTKRRRAIIETHDESGKTAVFVGPDNGIFSRVISASVSHTAWEIARPPAVSWARAATFDGRDVFAPVAARLAAGANPASFGGQIGEIVQFGEDQSQNPSRPGVITHFDRFGNAITDLRGALCAVDRVCVSIGPARSVELRPVRNYGEITAGNCAVLINSQGFIEIAANCASAREKLSLEVGMEVVLTQPR